MNWSDRMNSAIAYIENNLENDVDINEIAKHASSSSYHFQRMFFAIIGITPAQYIRRRRLTLAATDLASDNKRVIDIALKYGYQSPNAFTRAFRNMHGVNPKDVSYADVKLSAFNRVFFNVEIKGGDNMNYKIIKKPAFNVVGKSKKFTYDAFLKEGSKFWKNYVNTDEYKTLWDITGGKCGIVSEAPLMSIYMPESGTRETFVDVLAIEKLANTDTKHFEIFQISAATYAEFQCTYQTSMKMNKYIYSEWFSSTGYERDNNKPDIAAYFPIAFGSIKEMGVRWWIPVIKK
jgi:AraC family transcriptional regulator